MQLHWLMFAAFACLAFGSILLTRYLWPGITEAVGVIRISLAAPLPRHILGCFVGFALFCGCWVAFTACASARPVLQDARDEFVKVCNALTAATLADAQPSKVERIASKVCLAEKMTETIEHEVVSDGEGLGLFTTPAPFSDAGAR